MYIPYQYIQHNVYTNYVLAQGYCDFQSCIDNDVYAPDYDSSDMQVVIGIPDPSSLQWNSFTAIQNAIQNNMNAYILNAFNALTALIPDVTTLSSVLLQLTNLKATFELQNSTIMSNYIQSCVDTPLVSDSTLNGLRLYADKPLFSRTASSWSFQLRKELRDKNRFTSGC
jgi:hypothetical protein